MFLITHPGERHEDHIPLVLLSTKKSVKEWFKKEYEGFHAVFYWKKGWIKVNEPGCRNSAFGLHILEVEFGKRIKHT